MEVDKKVRMWRILRIPLIALVSLVIAVVLTISLALMSRGARIKRSIEENREKNLRWNHRELQDRR